MRVITVDPGLSTGLAVFNPEGTLQTQQIVGRMDLYRWFELEAVRDGVTYLVCENWRPRSGALTEQVDPHRIIGYLEGRAHFLGWPFHLQNVGDVKKFVTNEKLKAMGWWVPGQDHARDALRHLLYFLIHNRHPELAELRGAYVARLAEVLS